MTSPSSAPKKAASRRRASRAAGPAAGGEASTGAVKVDAPKPRTSKPARPAGPPPRRPANRRLVAIAALVSGFVAAAAVAAVVVLMLIQQNHAEAQQERNQRFVDTASQTVVNMFSFKQDSVEDSVNRFYSGTSGPLRDMLSQSNNVENLEAIFRDTGGSSEAVINGAALESIDTVADNAAVLVSVRVTVSDQNGNNKPSQPYRMRVIVHEDDSGRMTAYDLKYPDGGN
ncbi:mammalian cell entry protein [Mycobacterium sp.]|uniref:mammalian cell entry protein n=1 Tax=Mycobacterium sp. TaxID=1785 RepID=UPI002CE781A3|nr:mammalian cell entry protein [Mycobacterium sp.]HME48773.1 mammalian cell entry protein [Mycobacterium sp.]